MFLELVIISHAIGKMSLLFFDIVKSFTSTLENRHGLHTMFHPRSSSCDSAVFSWSWTLTIKSLLCDKLPMQIILCEPLKYISLLLITDAYTQILHKKGRILFE